MAHPAAALSFPDPRPGRVVVLGVGNVMNGDDGAGVCVVRLLAERMAATPGVLLVDGGTAPENFTGPIRRFEPDVVIEIDAADQNQPAGTTAWLDWRDADGMSASTHTLPPSVLATFLSQDLGCRVALIGVQPETLEMGRALSPAVAAAVGSLAEALAAWLSGR
jgi:hydrogenase 3 maturation protease